MIVWDDIETTVTKKADKLGGEYRSRLKIELKEIDKQGANDYWIDLFESKQKFDANDNGLVLPWLLGITSIDPIGQNIEHAWERQSDFPDIDIDFLPISRADIKKYVAEKYKEDYICSVGNWITYKPKSALHDVTRAHGGNLKVVIDLTTSLPDDFDDLDLETLLEYRTNDDDEAKKFENFYTFYDNHKEIVEIAFRCVGMIKAQGTHAGGVIISSHRLNGLVPMSLPKSSGDWTSQWTEGRTPQLSKFGLIKFDLLGLKTIYYIWRCGELIRQNRGIEINWSIMEPEDRVLGEITRNGTAEPIMMDDPESMAAINGLKTESIFQHETPIQKRIIEQGKVKDFWDMVAYTSLGRPGPMEMIPSYIENRDGIRKIGDKDDKFDWHDELDEEVSKILEETHGIITFQEQLTEIWIKLGRFTIPQAEESRKIISKKWVDKLPRVKQRWIDNATIHLGKDEAERWWDLMNSFGRYAFNKSHAVAYSIISFRCLYLKTHFAPEWWAAVMSSCHIDRIPKYMGVARSEDVEFASPDVCSLLPEYSVSDGKVTLGIQSIKGVGEKTAEQFAKNEEYEGLDDFIKKCGKNRTVLERLIKLGAFDRFHSNRKALFSWYLYKYGSGKGFKEHCEVINKHFEWTEEQIQTERDRQAEEFKKMYPKRKIPKKIQNWKPKIGPRHDTPSREQVMALFSDFEMSERLAFEKEYLGYYWTSPMTMFKTNGNTIDAAKNSGVLEAVIESIELRKTGKGSEFLVLHVTDGVELGKVTVWANAFASSDDYLFNEGVGIKVNVNWNERYGNFALQRGEIVMPLERIKDDDE